MRNGPDSVQGTAAIALFAKAPLPGLVKTRLIPTLTPEEAARVARAALDDTVRHIVPAVRARWALYLDGAADESLESLAADHGVTITYQRGADLGERLAAAFTEMREKGGHPILAIGSDSPTVDPGRIRVAIQALTTVDVVLGPAEDGGYYLVGMRGAHEAIFREIPWGTETVTARTLARAAALGLTVRLLEPWYDIDEASSLLRARGDCPADGRRWEIRAVVEGLQSKLESGV